MYVFRVLFLILNVDVDVCSFCSHCYCVLLLLLLLRCHPLCVYYVRFFSKNGIPCASNLSSVSNGFDAYFFGTFYSRTSKLRVWLTRRILFDNMKILRAKIYTHTASERTNK